jgi:FAD/FMN-containing dehydrogenase
MANLDQLRSTQSTPPLTPDDDGYAEASQRWGPPAAPDVLVRPSTPQEVGAALAWSAAEGIEVAVRSGAHGPWVPLPGGLLVDLGAFAQVEVGDDAIVSVGPGATWGAVADALTPHGLALSSGDTRSVGVGGNTLAAGVGWLVRSVGLAVDQLVGVQLATADGRLIEASEDENPELFFAVRGGGGNFGVATRLDFRARRVGHVVSGSAPVDPERLGAAIRGVRDAMRCAPHELGVTLVKPPPMGPDASPMVIAVWAGDDEGAARSALEPLLASDGVGEVELRVVPYASMLADLPEGPPGPPPRMTSDNGVFAELSDATVDRATAALAAYPTSMLDVRFLGGAFGEVSPEATAIAWRDAEVMVHWITFLPPDASDGDLAEASASWASVGDDAEAVCGSFTDSRAPELVERMYPPVTLERLRAVKAEWDPENRFRRNHNIRPA